MYKILNLTNAQFILRMTDKTVIPMELANTDYQAYLKWLEEGNTPLPADEPTQGAA